MKGGGGRACPSADCWLSGQVLMLGCQKSQKAGFYSSSPSSIPQAASPLPTPQPKQGGAAEMKRKHCCSVAAAGGQSSDRKRAKNFWIEELLGDGGQQRERRPMAGEQQQKTASRAEGRQESGQQDQQQEGGQWLRPGNPEALAALDCELENREMWSQFAKLGTEMIITKSGRRMFPVLRLRFSGALPGHSYLLFLDVVPVEREHRFRYRYDKSQWKSAGKAEPAQFGRLFPHPDNPFTAEQLVHQIVSFDKAKLTNSDKCNGDEKERKEKDLQLLLNSMHKYRPRVHCVCAKRQSCADIPRQFLSREHLQLLANFDYKTFEFEETKFVAVTAYQNQLVTQKKIELNPFAKGFRDQKGEEERTKFLVDRSADRKGGGPQPSCSNPPKPLEQDDPMPIQACPAIPGGLSLSPPGALCQVLSCWPVIHQMLLISGGANHRWQTTEADERGTMTEERDDQQSENEESMAQDQLVVLAQQSQREKVPVE